MMRRIMIILGAALLLTSSGCGVFDSFVPEAKVRVVVSVQGTGDSNVVFINGKSQDFLLSEANPSHEYYEKIIVRRDRDYYRDCGIVTVTVVSPLLGTSRPKEEYTCTDRTATIYFRQYDFRQ